MNVEKLREELFATLAALRDKDNPMDIERAKAVVQVADAITATAKVEIEHMRITGGKGCGFIPLQDANSAAREHRAALPPPNGKTASKGLTS